MTRLIARGDVAALMSAADYLAAVESAFLASARGIARSPPPLHIDVVGGAFHAKGAALIAGRTVAALKLNGNFPGNPARGLPTIQGVIVLCDGESGEVLALLDSIEITLRRTAAATALAARARKNGAAASRRPGSGCFHRSAAIPSSASANDAALSTTKFSA